MLVKNKTKFGPYFMTSKLRKQNEFIKVSFKNYEKYRIASRSEFVQTKFRCFYKIQKMFRNESHKIYCLPVRILTKNNAN